MKKTSLFRMVASSMVVVWSLALLGIAHASCACGPILQPGGSSYRIIPLPIPGWNGEVVMTEVHVPIKKIIGNNVHGFNPMEEEVVEDELIEESIDA